MDPALYTARVIHQRFTPFRHGFAYRVFSLLIDIDRIGLLTRNLRLLSHNRFNLFSFHDRDHGDGKSALRPWVTANLAEAGIADPPGGWGAIHLLCFPRILGYVFNPLAVYYCADRSGSVRAILYQVSNTFGERHCYAFAVGDGGRVEAHRAAKIFHVSPFFTRDGRYRFRLTIPEREMLVAIRYDDATGPKLTATIKGRREALSDRQLLRRFFTHPLMTWKVIAAIHTEALRLVVKGARYHRKPAAMVATVSRAEPVALGVRKHL